MHGPSLHSAPPLLSLSTPQLLSLASHLSQELTRRGRHSSPLSLDLGVPAEIFSLEISPGEALVKYLKENRKLRYSEIAQIIKRDERGIWSTYQRAARKMPAPFGFDSSAHLIPLSAFGDRRLSLFESVLVYVVDQEHQQISSLVGLFNKSYSTLYTTYRRAKAKQGGGVHA